MHHRQDKTTGCTLATEAMEQPSVVDSLEDGKPTPLQQGPSPRVWTTIALAGTIALWLLPTGALFVIGRFTLVPVPAMAPRSPPPPQSPPPSPTHPPLGPGMMLLEQEGDCATQVSGIWVSQIKNGRCQDGGSSSESNLCFLGNDFPDCPLRMVPAPSPPPLHPPPARRH